MRCVIVSHVIAVGQQPTLNPFDQVWATRTYVQVFTSRKQGIPQWHADIATLNVDFKTALLGITRTGNRHLAAFKVKPVKAEETDVADAFTEHTNQQFFSLRTLNS